MRVQLGLLAALGVVLASACSSSNTTDGGSGTSGGTAGTTGGSTTGGSTGGTSSGGTSGGGLADGTACTGNTQCLSGICGLNGGGRCCTVACSTSDATCAAMSCDMTGACNYPAATTACGTDSCTNGTLTQSTCSMGTCTAGTPAPCPNGLQCADATTCRTQCNATQDCVTGFYCNTSNHACVAQVAHGPCTTNEACTSGVCGIAGTGNCCTAQCGAAADPACNPTSCDVASGACVYPSGNACGTSICTGNTLTAGTCDPVGACNTATGPCPNNLICDPAGTACLPTCATSADCVTNFYCNATHCLPKVAFGACTTNEACSSGICGVKGTGHCCTAACDTSDPACGAKDCDNAGACSFPNNHTTCGLPASCTGNTQVDPTTCDGAGTCQPQGTTDCTPFICGANACLTSCKSSASCIAGDFCDTGAGSCCSGLGNGGTIAVDSATGNDTTACCGIGGNGACQTLTNAMALIDSAQAQNVTITATVNGGGGDWSGESYPVMLGWGVELNAPGVFFLDTNAVNNASILDINFYSKNDTVGYASIVGSAKSQVGVGMDSTGLQTDSESTILVETGNTLYIANASVNGSFSDAMGNEDSQEALLVNPGATLVLGQDQSGGITGTVNVGNALGAQSSDGWQGIKCDSDFVSLGCTIKDAALVGQSSVVIQGQEFQDLDAEDFANISLTSAPVIGVPPSSAGFGNCPQKVDGQTFNGGQAVALNGSVTFTFNNGTVQCIAGPGFALISSGNGSPIVKMDSTVIQNTDLAIEASAGTATITNTMINYNYYGVLQATDGVNNGTINLSGGGNTVICSDKKESSQNGSSPGVDVYNTSTINLAADNVAWDTPGPDFFSCDPAFTSCLCNIASCSTSVNNDDMDAVEDSTNVGGITTSGNTQSPNACK